MNVKVEEAGVNKLKLEIEVGSEAFEDGLAKSFKKNARRFSVPGFRVGRAPRSVVERHYGAEVLYSDAVEFICSEYYEKALTENNIEPIDRPRIDIGEIERGAPFTFTAVVDVKPKVTLGGYIGIEAEMKRVIVTEEEVEDEIKSVADKNARIIPVEDRPTQIGDTVQIDYEGFIDGVPFEGGKNEAFNLELGSNRFIKGFEEQLTGKSAGDFVKVEICFPDDYHNKDLCGKDAVFDVTIHSVKSKELPEIDDEFAQDVSEFDTLDEYKADLRKQLTLRGEERAKSEFENALVDKIVNDAQVEIPDILVERQAENNLRQFNMTLAYQGLDVDRYLEMGGIPREEFEASMNKRALAEVKTQLVLEQIAQDNKLAVTDADYEEELRKRAETYKKDYDEYVKTVSDDLAGYIRSKLTSDKIIKFLSDNAKPQIT